MRKFKIRKMTISLEGIVFQFGLVLVIVISNYFLKEVHSTYINPFGNIEELVEESNVINPYANIPQLPVGARAATNREIMPRLDNRNHFHNNNNVFIQRPRPRCNRKIRILNGVTRFRDKGSFVRYECSHGFTLVGASVGLCILNQWSEPPPICVRPGCRRIQQPVNGMAMVTYGGAAVVFYCKNTHEYILEGSVTLYCDGNRWNGTEPICKPIHPPTTTIEPSTELESWPQDIFSMSTPPSHTQPPLKNFSLSPTSLTAISTTENSRSWDYNAGTSTSISFIIESSTIPETLSPSVAISSSTFATPTEKFQTDRMQIISSAAIPSEEPEQKIQTTPKLVVSTQQSETSPSTMTFFTTRVLSSTPIPIVETDTKTSTTLASTAKTPAIYFTEPTISNVTLPPKRSTTQKPKKKFKKTTMRPMRRTTKSRTKTTPTTTTTIKSTTMSIISKVTIDYEPFPDNTFERFDEEILGKPYDSRVPEFIQPLDPISPHKLDDRGGSDYEYYHKVAHMSIIGGVVLAGLGIISLMGGIIMYCWRKNKGIARARACDIDGRTLSAASDAYDDFMWLENRDSSSRL